MVRMNPGITVIALPLRHRREKVTIIVSSVKGIKTLDIILYADGKNLLVFSILLYTDLQYVRVISFGIERSFCSFLGYLGVITV